MKKKKDAMGPENNKTNMKSTNVWIIIFQPGQSYQTKIVYINHMLNHPNWIDLLPTREKTNQQ